MRVNCIINKLVQKSMLMQLIKQLMSNQVLTHEAKKGVNGKQAKCKTQQYDA